MNDESILLGKHCKYTKSHCTVHLKCVNFVLCNYISTKNNPISPHLIQKIVLIHRPWIAVSVSIVVIKGRYNDDTNDNGKRGELGEIYF